MSYYNHMHDPPEIKATCQSCSKEFKWVEHGPHYPGGTGTEFINCPYCGEKNGSVRTSGFVYTSKTD